MFVLSAFILFRHVHYNGLYNISNTFFLILLKSKKETLTSPPDHSLWSPWQTDCWRFSVALSEKKRVKTWKCAGAKWTNSGIDLQYCSFIFILTMKLFIQVVISQSPFQSLCYYKAFFNCKLFFLPCYAPINRVYNNVNECAVFLKGRRHSTIVFILTITHFNIYLDTDWKLFLLNMNARAKASGCGKALDEDVCWFSGMRWKQMRARDQEVKLIEDRAGKKKKKNTGQLRAESSSDTTGFIQRLTIVKCIAFYILTFAFCKNYLCPMYVNYKQ